MFVEAAHVPSIAFLPSFYPYPSARFLPLACLPNSSGSSSPAEWGRAAAVAENSGDRMPNRTNVSSSFAFLWSFSSPFFSRAFFRENVKCRSEAIPVPFPLSSSNVPLEPPLPRDGGQGASTLSSPGSVPLAAFSLPPCLCASMCMSVCACMCTERGVLWREPEILVLEIRDLNKSNFPFSCNMNDARCTLWGHTPFCK